MPCLLSCLLSTIRDIAASFITVSCNDHQCSLDWVMTWYNLSRTESSTCLLGVGVFFCENERQESVEYQDIFPRAIESAVLVSFENRGRTLRNILAQSLRTFPSCSNSAHVLTQLTSRPLTTIAHDESCDECDMSFGPFSPISCAFKLADALKDFTIPVSMAIWITASKAYVKRLESMPPSQP